MDLKKEYHDPDYPATSGTNHEVPTLSADGKVEKIKQIVRREFNNELEVRENEVMVIDQRVFTARKMLHRLRYALVNSYYQNQKLMLTSSQIQDEVAAQHEPRAQAEVSSLLKDGQRRIHPSVRKLLGKQTVDLDEIFKFSGPRNKVRKDYSAMVQKRNYTIAADSTKSLRPEKERRDSQPAEADNPSTSRPKKVPRRLEPKVENIQTVGEVTRNKMKHRFRIIIGNTSKYAPPASRMDRSTHKWLLYVRGAPPHSSPSPPVVSVVVRLHHSYAPHHVVHLHKPPFHISRRGWGEFPAKVELNFEQPELNRSAIVEHTIKLDRNFTGLQTLGAETIVDVWLYSTPEMLPYEYKEENDQTTTLEQDIKKEIDDVSLEEHIIKTEPSDNWMDFFNTASGELDVDQMIIKPIKKEPIDSEDMLNGITDEHNDVSKVITDRRDIEMLIEQTVISKEPETIEEPANIAIKKEPEDYTMDMPSELLNQPTSPKKRIMKYMDPNTGKIYYLELDRNLDLSKVQEIVINSKGSKKTAKISPLKPNSLKSVRRTPKKGGISLLKPEVKSLLKSETKVKKPMLTDSFKHIENDHCYLSWQQSESNQEEKLPDHRILETLQEDVEVKKEENLFQNICEGLRRLHSVREAVNFLLKKIPVISQEAKDPDFSENFPFVVENDENYWKLDFAKRRNIEWSRAKLISTILTDRLQTTETIWRTKQILIYSRLHGFYPFRQERFNTETETLDGWSAWTGLDNSRTPESKIKELYPKPEDLSTLSVFQSNVLNISDTLELSDSDDEIDIVKCDSPVKVKKEPVPSSSPRAELTMLPAFSEEDRLRFLFIERKCGELGIELKNEDVGSGYSYSAVHAVLLSAMRSFAEELVRSALAAKLCETTDDNIKTPIWAGSSTSRPILCLEHFFEGVRQNPRLHVLTNEGLGTDKKQTCPL